jgi:hypothetical protein
MSEIARLKARKEALFTNFATEQRSLVSSIEETPVAPSLTSAMPSVERESQETASRPLQFGKALDMSIVTED